MLTLERRPAQGNKIIESSFHRGSNALAYFDGGRYTWEETIGDVAHELTRTLGLKHYDLITPPPGQASESDIALVKVISEICSLDEAWMSRLGNSRGTSIVAMQLSFSDAVSIARDMTGHSGNQRLAIGCGRLMIPHEMQGKPTDMEWMQRVGSDHFVPLVACQTVSL